MITSAIEPATTGWAVASEATQLIDRYPDLDPTDLDRLIDIYPQLPMVQLALMSSDEELAPRLEAFKRDHRKRIRTPFHQYGALMIPVVLMAMVVLWTMVG